MPGQVVPICAGAPPLVSAALAEKRERGTKASWKTGARWLRAPLVLEVAVESS
jgi:hypothetical protein